MSLLRVKESFAVMNDLNGRIYREGEMVDEKDPVVKNRARYFEPADDAIARRSTAGRVETATAAPGEKRSVTKPPTKRAAKKAAKKAPAKKAATPAPAEVKKGTAPAEKPAES